VAFSELARNRILVGGAAAAVGAVVLVYPYLTEGVLDRFGVRPPATALLALALLPVLLAGRGPWPERGAALRWAFVVVLAAAAITGSRTALYLVPALVHLSAAAIFHASLADEESLIERAVRFMVPEAPDFIRSYCRKLTAMWVGFFAASAAVIAALAVLGTPEQWRAFSGWIVYALMLGITAVEFCVRKTWFRYYFHGGLVDRAWSRLFPAENTPQGRRSQAYIRWVREQRAESVPGARQPARR